MLLIYAELLHYSVHKNYGFVNGYVNNGIDDLVIELFELSFDCFSQIEVENDLIVSPIVSQQYFS